MASAMIGFTGCSDEETIGGGPGLSTEFVVSRSDMQFTKNGGESQLFVKAGTVPTVTSDASWLNVTSVAGTSTVTHQFMVEAQPNTDNNDRTATITVNAGSDSKTITVTQNSTEGLLVTSAKTIDVAADGGQFSVTLQANANYEQVISKDWVTEITSRANMVEYTRNYQVAANISNERSATISYTMVVNDSTSITEAITINQAHGAMTADMSKSAMDIAAMMYPGWNLGNTLEAGSSGNLWNNAGISTETSWQSVKTTKELIDLVKASGFKSVRIPCAWAWGHITDAEACTIDPDWMARVHEVVDYCIQNGLYVILNEHYDGGWLEHDGFTAKTDVDACKDKLSKIWTQIANSFKDYDEHLIFAGMNEPGVGTGNDEKLIGVADMAARIAEYEQVFVNAVRATGGNNMLRVLIVQGPNTNIDNFVDNNYMSKIEDPASDRLMVEVHYYAPYQFTDLGADASWGKYWLYWGKNNTGGNVERTADAEYNEDYVEAQMAKMKSNFFDKGYPVLIGEFGANQRTAIGQDALHDKSVKDYYKAVVTSAINNGCIPVAWDTNAGLPSMTIFNRAAVKVGNENVLKSIQEAVTSATWPTK